MNSATLSVLLGFLRAGRVLDAASSVLLLGSLGLAWQPAPMWLAAGVLAALGLGLFEKYLAWRVALDAEFFELLRQQPGATPDFDQALAEFRGQGAVVSPPPPRDLPSRWRGARRLVLRQAWALVAQAGLVAALVAARLLA